MGQFWDHTCAKTSFAILCQLRGCGYRRAERGYKMICLGLAIIIELHTFENRNSFEHYNALMIIIVTIRIVITK